MFVISDDLKGLFIGNVNGKGKNAEISWTKTVGRALNFNSIQAAENFLFKYRDVPDLLNCGGSSFQRYVVLKEGNTFCIEEATFEHFYAPELRSKIVHFFDSLDACKSWIKEKL